MFFSWPEKGTIELPSEIIIINNNNNNMRWLKTSLLCLKVKDFQFVVNIVASMFSVWP